MIVQNAIESKLKSAFTTRFLEVENESHRHNVPDGSETHFKVTLVSEDFSGLTKVKCHQQIYATLSNEMEQGVHALAIHSYTPDQWAKINSVPESPNCLGKNNN